MKYFQWFNTKSILRISFLFIFIFLLTRCLFLDQDLPPYGISFYSPIDEGVYSELALNQINYNTYDPNAILNAGMSFFVTGQMINNLFGNLCSFAGIFFLGDNYYGLRVPYVFLNLITILTIANILFVVRKRYGSNDKKDIYVLAAILFYLLFDFIFLMSGRVVEPSAVRSVFVQFVILEMFIIENLKKRFFVLGFTITISVFLAYITNVFLFIALFCSAVVVGLRLSKRKFFTCILCAFTGFMVALGLCELYYHSVWDTGAVANALASIFSFSSGNDRYASGGAYVIFKHIARFFTANSLLYNIIPIFVFLCTIGKSLLYCLEKKDERISFIIFIPIAFLIQTMYSEDYIVRKFIIIYPSIWYLLYFRYLISRHQINTNKRMRIWFERNENRICISAALFCGLIYLYRIFLIKDGSQLDFSKMDKLVLLLSVIVIFFYAIYNLSPVNKKKFTYNTLRNLFFLSVFINCFFSIKYVFLHPTYTEKAIMLEMNSFNNKYILGEYAGIYTLYNDSLVVVNSRDKLASFMQDKQDLLYFDYGDDYLWEMRKFFDDDLFAGRDYTVVPIVRYDREFKVFGKKRPFAVYKVIHKNQLEMYYNPLREKYVALKENMENDYIMQVNYDEQVTMEMVREKYPLEKWEFVAIDSGCFNYYRNRENSLMDDFYIEKNIAMHKKNTDIQHKFDFLWF